MMSKNSFLASIKENNKRRTWLWIVASLFWFFYYPVAMAMLMSRKRGDNIMDNLVGDAARLRLVQAAEGWLSADRILTAVCVCTAAVVCAIQGFSYLYSRKKVDMYHSVPVKKSRRFAVIFVNGTLIYLIPYTVSLLFALLVAGINGGMNVRNLQMGLTALLLHGILFLGVYGLTAIAVMLTGNLIITLFATVILLTYEMVVAWIPQWYGSEFYNYYSYYSCDDMMFFSPLRWFGQAAEAAAKTKEGIGVALRTEWIALLAGLLLAAAFAGIAYFCYRKRPAEAAGRAMAFAKTKPFVKILLVIPFALLVTMEIRDLVGMGNTALFAAFGMVAAVVLGSCVIEVIYEADIWAAFRKKSQILISGICTAAIYCIFCFDLTGYDAWVPRQEELQDAVFLFLNRDSRLNHVDENLVYMDVREYALARPGVGDTEAVCQITAKKDESGHREDAMWCDVAYRMKNGRVVWRKIPIDSGEVELLDRIMGSREYKEAAYPLYADEAYESIRQHKVKELYFSNGFKTENLAVKDMDELRSAWKQDMEGLDYSTLKGEFKTGRFTIVLEKNRRASLTYDIYPSFEHTLTFLKEKGIRAEGYLDVESIESIAVTNFHNELREAMAREAGRPEATEEIDWDALSVSRTFTEEEDIRDLAEAIYPIDMGVEWKDDDVSNNYFVTIHYKDGETDSSNYRGSNNARLITEKIPDWLEQATAYE
ncbi:MAG: DUF6449 domain-containing protein [Lachnospiraceae bacterium]|nr:DUF6449 domain-containing protein [Lachnospiraceae bacterium]